MSLTIETQASFDGTGWYPEAYEAISRSEFPEFAVLNDPDTADNGHNEVMLRGSTMAINGEEYRLKKSDIAVLGSLALAPRGLAIPRRAFYELGFGTLQAQSTREGSFSSGIRRVGALLREPDGANLIHVSNKGRTLLYALDPSVTFMQEGWSISSDGELVAATRDWAAQRISRQLLNMQNGVAGVSEAVTRPNVLEDYTTVELGAEENWQESALCAQTDPEAFFPETGGSTREAKRICSGCDVRAECLDYALAHDEHFGIWGGLSERERRRLRRGEIKLQ